MLTRRTSRTGRGRVRRGWGGSGLTGERGSVTVFAVVFAVAVIFMLGLIIDGGIAMNARQRALDIAGQAARAAADDIKVDTLRATGQAVIDQRTACAVAGRLVNAYARAAIDGADSGVDRVTQASMTGCKPYAQSATVWVTVTTKSLLPGVFNGFTESAHESATVRCGITTGGGCP